MIKPIYEELHLNEAWKLVQSAKTITLLTHYRPDADGISACAALAHILETLGKRVNAIYPTEPDQLLRLQPQHVTINHHDIIPDLIITLDTANYDRLYYPDSFKNVPLINIDHHVSNSITGTFNFNNPQSSSTCEELYVLLHYWASKHINAYVAECLLFGILYDTQVFSTQSTAQQTLFIAADLMNYGVVMSKLCMELFATKSPKVLAFWGELLCNLKTSLHEKAILVSVTQQCFNKHALSPDALNGFSNFLWQMSTADISIILYETEQGKTKVSLRSKVADVNALAHKFGGGGHKHASGIMIDKPITQVEQEIMDNV